MVNFIQQLRAGHELAEPVMTPPGFKGALLPPEDAADSDSDSEVARALASARRAPINRALVIEYADSQGDVSVRRARLIDVVESRGRVYLSCYCLERRAPRLFRRDRVLEAFCGVTGEALGDPAEAFRPRGVIEFKNLRPARREVDHETPALKHARAALRVLMTIARADGRVHPLEERVIEGFIRAYCGDCAADAEGLIMEAFHTAPSFEGFLDACEAVFSEGAARAMGLLEAAPALAEADGVVHTLEVDVLEDLAGIARACGYDVELEFSGAR